QRGRRVVAAVLAEVSGPDEAGIERNLRRSERRVVAGEAFAADPELGRAGQVRDPDMAEPDEVVDREPRAAVVVDLDERHRLRAHVAVEADDREAVLDELGDALRR